MRTFERLRDVLAAWRPFVATVAVVALGTTIAALDIPVASAQSDDGDSERVTLAGSHDDVQFLVGKSVKITATVSDDVFAAGRDVTFDAASVRNAIVGGYDVELRGGTVADLIAVGANINISGDVQDDLVAAARSLRLSSAGTVAGDVRVAAETAEIEGTVTGNVRAAARRVTIAGSVGGKVDLLAERVVIGPNARIAGDLIYRSREAPEIADGAVITGEVRRVELPIPDLKRIGLAILGIGIAIALAWAMATLLLIVIIQLAFPAFMTEATDRLRERPWANLGRGVALLLVSGALAGLFYASILGIPLGGALSMAIAIGSLLGLATTSYCIGLLIRGRLKDSTYVGGGARVGWAILGAVILGLVGLIPLLGAIIVGLAVAAGVGAAMAELWTRLRAA